MAIDRTQTLGPRDPSSDGVAETLRAPGDALPATPSMPAERYELEAEHGRGGIGRVVRARDRHLGRTVVVKELLRTNELAEAMFVREAMITARLQHPGIVPVHEAGRWPNGDPYYVMKMVSGRTLKEVIAGTTNLADRLALLPHVIAVAEAVGYAHSQEVIHRDLKPANVLLGDYGETVVIDWGLARDLRSSDATPEPRGGSSGPHDGTRTVTGKVVGTPQYMSPEQARGDYVDARTDVYALGAMLYEVLSAHAPVAGDSAQQVLDRVLAGPPEPLRKVVPGLPADLDAIVSKAMQRAPTDRYVSARELAADLKRFQTGQLVTAQVYGRWKLARRWIRKNRGYVALATAAMAALAMIAIGLVRRVVEERTLAEARGRQAEIARSAAEDRKNQLVLAQAQAALPRDPTATLAWLKNFPIDERTVTQLAALVDEAEAGGVARHVWRTPAWVMGVAVSRDGSKVATAARDGKVRVIDAVSGETKILGERPMLSAVAFDPMGTRLMTADGHGEVWRWDLSTGKGQSLGTHEKGELHFEPAANGLMATRAMDNTIKLWDLDRGEVVDELFAELPQVERTAAAWDGVRGKLRLTGTFDGRIVMWNGDQSREITRLPGPVHYLVMTQDGRHGLAADGRTAYWMDLAGGKVTRIAENITKMKQMVIDPTGRRAAIAGDDPDVIIVSVETGAVERRRGHTDALYGPVWDGRGERLVTPSDDGTIRVWDLDTGDSRVLRGHEDDVYAAAMTPDGHVVATASLDGSARLWRIDDRKTVVVGQLGDVRLARPLGDDRVRIVSTSDPIRITDVDLRNRTSQVRLETPSTRGKAILSKDGSTVIIPTLAHQTVIWRDGETQTFATARSTIYGDLSADGKRAVAMEQDGAIRIYDDRGETLLRAKGPTEWFTMRRDGLRVAAMGNESLEVFDTISGKVVAQLPRRGKAGMEKQRADFTDDGHHVVVTDLEGVQLWNLDDGAVVSLGRSAYSHEKIATSPDGGLIALAVEDRAVRLWDTKTGKERITLRGHRDLVSDVAFSPDGRRLVTGSYDKTVRVWNLASGEGQVLSGHVGPVWAVDWVRPDQVVSGSSDGTVRLWTLPDKPAPDAEELRERLSAETTAVIDDGNRPATPTML